MAIPDENGKLHVNLALAGSMVDNPGVGVMFGSVTSAGYAPYADGPTAIAALMALSSGPVYAFT